MKTRITLNFLAASLCFLVASCVSQRGEHSLIPTQALPVDQRVVGFSLSLSNACFGSFPELPAGWSFEILNDPSWQGRMEAQVIVGAAAIDKNAQFFRRPIQVRFSPEASSSLNPECRIVLKTTKDFDPEHTQDVIITVPLKR